MVEPPRRVRPEHRTRLRVRRAAALGGLLLGIAALVGIGFGVRSLAAEDATPQLTRTQTQTATGPPPLAVLRIVFPEGFTRRQMAERIAAVNEIARKKRHVRTKLRPPEYLAHTKKGPLPRDFRDVKPPDLEGFLFPATYDFTKRTTTQELVDDQLDAFGKAWSSVDLRYADSKNLTPYDVLIIASMVEKEVQVPRERPLVAAVIYNRLRAGMELGIDATIRYGLGIPPTEPIHESELNSDSPYNTRKFTGLPPTPIANPGLASIEAAAHPAKVEYLYFVRKADCRSHFFTASKAKFDAYPRTGLQCG